MKNEIIKLQIFQKRFGGIVNYTPTLLSKADSELRFKMSQEELNEYKEACENNDKVEILDAIVDRIFLAIGDAVCHGMSHLLPAAFDEVYYSNMSKLDANNHPIINGQNGVFEPDKAIGKILKGEHYKKPDLEQFF